MYQQEGVMIPVVKARPRTVGDVMPAVIPLLLAVFQMVLDFAITGLEAASVYYDAGRGTIYAGFWCSVIFSVTWIAMFCYACCKRSSACGMYLIVQNILSAVFAIILIVFTALFIDNPCLCYGILCKVPNWDFISTSDNDYPYFRYNCTARTIRKLPVLKGLLSCAVLMLASNLIFIAVYLISNIWLRKKAVPAFQIQHPETHLYQTSEQYQQPYLAPTVSEAHYYTPVVETVPITEMPSAPPAMRSMRF